MLLTVQTIAVNLCKKNLHALVLVALLLNLSACGFQLRGAIDLSKDISPVFLQQGSLFDLAREIKLLLDVNKIEQVATAAQSKTQLILLTENKKQGVLSVDGNGRVIEYLLTYQVNFEIAFASASDPTPASSAPASIQTVKVTRSLVFDPNAVLAVSNEAEILFRDMQRDAARLILLKLEAFGVRDKLVSAPGLANSGQEEGAAK